MPTKQRRRQKRADILEIKDPGLPRWAVRLLISLGVVILILGAWAFIHMVDSAL